MADILRTICLSILAVAATATLHAEDLPSPKTGGVDGKPINLLVVSSRANRVPLIDPVYEKELRSAGYNLHVLSQEDMLTMDYVTQFGAVLVANLPYAGEAYTVPGYKNRFVEPNLKLLRKYVELGGGLLVVPAISEFGEAYGWTYDAFLEPWGAKLLIQQLKDGRSLKNQAGRGAYGAGSVISTHPISKALEGRKVLYPMNVMRWDNSYSCTPVITDRSWSILATADNARTYIALDNSTVGAPITKHNTLYAVRRAGKGMAAVSAIHSYYTLTMVSSTKPNVGENGTGVIDFQVMHGEKNGRPSVFGELVDRTLRAFAANSAKHGIGAWAGLSKPEAPPLPEPPATIDWTTQQPPPTWAHRVIPSKGWPRRYDELPDPSVAGEMKYWKMLIGPRTAHSSGSGSVERYRAAAIEAGYSAITFCETFGSLTKKKWDALVEECRQNTDEDFVCLPGLEIESYEGQRYLVLGAERFPAPDWLTEDGKRLAAVRMLSLGWFGHVSVVHRPEGGPLDPRTFKHYTGIAVATYDTRGKQVDDGFDAYQWSAASDSQPIPIAVHEVTGPADVKHAVRGYQQILPAPTLPKAVHYFRFAFSHAFDAPERYFISEGPILDGWCMFNKDIGKDEFNRKHFRMGIGIRAEDGETPIARVQLYDGFDRVRHWQPNQPEFRAVVDGSHNKQHLFTLLARDAKGRRVLSPVLRTVCNNYRGRCGDRQNWLGTQIVYTGWHRNGLPGYRLELANCNEGVLGYETPTILSFPFYGNNVQIQEADLGNVFAFGEMKQVAGDAKGMLPIKAKETVGGKIRYTYFTPLKQKTFAVMLVEAEITLRKDAGLIKPRRGNVNPVLAGGMRGNNLLILPNQAPAKLASVFNHQTNRMEKGDPRNASCPLPAGSYAGGIVPLTEGLHLDGREIGIPAAPGKRPKGTTWKARYLTLRGRPYHWKTNRSRGTKGDVVDGRAEQALTEMGFRGKTPYQFRLTQGRLDKTAYFAHFTAQNGGVAGRCINTSGKPMLMYVPLLIGGLDNDSEMIVWRSDSKTLDAFAALEGRGYVSFDADKTVDFYAGNAAICDLALVVSMVIWDADTAWFRVHNPTEREITSTFATPHAVKGFKAVKTTVTVPAGASVEVR